MTTLQIILLGFYFFAVLFFTISFFYRPLYMFVFEHKEWVQWRYWITSFSEFVYQCTYPDKSKKFVNMFDKKIVAYIWEDGRCSIHKGNKVLVGVFDKQHSKRMAELLSYLIKEEISLEDWIREQNM